MTYELDARVRAGARRSREDQDHARGELAFVVFDEETGDEIDARVPGRYEVCGTCEGRGRHVNPSIDSHGLSSEDFDEDPDFREDYFAGAYDVDCYACRGRTTVLVPDEDRMNDDQKALVDLRDRQEADAARDDAAAAYERRMGY